jgi:MFS family permease
VLFLYCFIGAGFHLWFALASGFWMFVAIALVGWVNPGVYGPSAIYAGELYPTHLRATAVGWFFGIGRIGSFLAPAVVGLMLEYGLEQSVLHTFALTFLIGAVAILFVGVETKGRVLETITAADDLGKPLRLSRACRPEKKGTTKTPRAPRRNPVPWCPWCLGGKNDEATTSKVFQWHDKPCWSRSSRRRTPGPSSSRR